MPSRTAVSVLGDVDNVGCVGGDGSEGPGADDDGRDGSPACPPEPEPESELLVSSIITVRGRSR